MPGTEEIKGMWTKALENAKLIASTIMVIAALMVGTWEIATNVFLTRAEASIVYEKLDIESSYNKAFRLETKIAALETIAKRRELSAEEKKILERLKRDLKRVDLHIDKIEKRIYDYKEE